MGLTVLNVAFPLAPVGAYAAGGAEQVLTWLDAALVAAGYASIVLAPEGSTAFGELWTIPSPSGRVLDDSLRGAILEAQVRALRNILERRAVDIIHMHGLDFLAYLPDPGIPVLVTLHLPLEWYPEEVFHLRRPKTYLHCVSYSQQRSAPAGACLLPPIENGVPIEALGTRYAKREFAAALGRICPEKGFHVALNAAKRAGISLLLAGKLFPYPAHQRYFTAEIAPRLDRRRRFIGAVGFGDKRRLLASARCLLAPSLVPETSSLVAMEALACGTPVVAFRSGALVEIINHGKSGFIVDNESDMAEAALAARDLDPEYCRETARERFSLVRMTAAYVNLYCQLARDPKSTSRAQDYE